MVKLAMRFVQGLGSAHSFIIHIQDSKVAAGWHSGGHAGLV